MGPKKDALPADAAAAAAAAQAAQAAQAANQAPQNEAFAAIMDQLNQMRLAQQEQINEIAENRLQQVEIQQRLEAMANQIANPAQADPAPAAEDGGGANNDANPAAAQRKPFKVTGRAPQFCLDKDRDSFLLWLEDWKCYLFSSGITQLDDEEDAKHYSYAQLRAALSMPTKRWLDSLDLSDEEAQDSDIILE